MSYVPEAEQRCWRTLTRTKYQLTRDKVRLQSQLESLLEECQIKLSSVVSDLLGASGQRILRALAQGETDPTRLAELGDKRLRASDAELKDALSGVPQLIHRQLLSLYLARFDLIQSHMESLDSMIAEIGPQAAAFPSAAQLASWVGVCPGRQESAGVSSSDRSAKGNRSMRRLLNQLAHAAVRKEDCQLQIVFRRLSSRLGYAKAVWAIAHRLCRLVWKILHEGVSYVEYGPAPTPIALKRRRQRLVTQLKKLGYQVPLIPATLDASSV